VSASLALGQDAGDKSFSITPYAQYQFNSNYGNATLHIAREGVDFDHDYNFTKQLQFNLGVKFEDSVYDWNDFRKESPGVKTPVDHVGLLRASPGLTYTINDRWTVRGSVIGQISGAYGANVGDSFTYGVLGMVIYRVNDRLTLGAGAVYYSQLEDDNAYLPIGSVVWKVSDAFVLSAVGTEVRASLYTRKDLNYYVAARYDTRQYRLEDNAPYSSGVVYDSDIPVVVGVQWQPSEQFKISGEVGAIAWQKITFDDENGHRIVKDNVDPTVFLGLKFTYSW